MKPDRRGFGRAGALLLGGCLLFATACSTSGDRDDVASAPAGNSPPAQPPGTVALTESQQAAAGIHLLPLVAQRRQIQSRSWGRVLSVGEFATVRQALLAARAAVAAAQAQDEQARAELQRTEKLFAQGATLSQKSLESARAAAEVARSDLSTAEASLALQRATAAQAWGPRLATELESGGGKAADLLAFRAAPLLVAPRADGPTSAPERAEVVDGQRLLPAELVSVVPRTDGVLQGPGWLYAVAAAPVGLSSGQNLEVLLPTGPERSGVEVPHAAVVWWQGGSWVYRRETPGTFRRIALVDAQPTAHGWFVSGGVAPGDALVVDGAQVLFSEEMKIVSPTALED